MSNKEGHSFNGEKIDEMVILEDIDLCSYKVRYLGDEIKIVRDDVVSFDFCGINVDMHRNFFYDNISAIIMERDDIIKVVGKHITGKTSNSDIGCSNYENTSKIDILYSRENDKLQKIDCIEKVKII